MKKFIVIAFLGLAQLLSAQSTRTIGEFSTVKAFDQIDVLLIKSKENKVEISGSRKDDVEIVTKNDELKIRMKLTKLLKGDEISVTVYYTGNIDHVEASEGARVASQDLFKATSFELNAKEGAEIKLKLDVKKLKSKASSGGILSVDGSAANHDVVITSGGILNATNLETSQTAISINAGGEANINASEYVDAKTRAGGDIKIYGNPKQVDKKQVIGGTITIVGQ
ncbi:head GIN domain-containing protein [Flavobacterium sp. DGU11]|uniref:Head GIN domain-containing protein n=1 Tax=Flavobacterium arundinis TaxID=3139143 RepID=A0ABU9I0U1_9FLAO